MGCWRIKYNMENEMGFGGISGLKELSSSYDIGETKLITMYAHYGHLILSSSTAIQSLWQDSAAIV